MNGDSPIKRTSPEGWVSTGLLLGVFVVILLQIFSRHLPLPIPIWTEELSRWLWVWLVFVGMAEVERADSHLKMDLFADKIAFVPRTVLFMAIDVLCIAVFVELIHIGTKGALRNLHATAVTLPVTMIFFYAAYPVAGIFIVLRIVQRLVRRGRLVIERLKGGAR